MGFSDARRITGGRCSSNGSVGNWGIRLLLLSCLVVLSYCTVLPVCFVITLLLYIFLSYSYIGRSGLHPSSVGVVVSHMCTGTVGVRYLVLILPTVSNTPYYIFNNIIFNSKYPPRVVAAWHTDHPHSSVRVL